MRNLFFICILSVKLSFLFGQIYIPKLKNSVTSIADYPMITLQPLLTKSKIIIMYRTYSSWGNDEFKVISFQKDSSWHAYILKDSADEFGHYSRISKYNWLKSINPPQDSIKLIWQTFIDNDIFTLRNEDQNDASCDLIVHDANHYEIKILTQAEYKVLNYYTPDTFEKECPGNIKRQKIIRVIKVFNATKIFQNQY